MKKTSLLGIPVLGIIITGIFLCISPSNAGAQTFVSTGNNYPGGTFVTPVSAISLLQDQMDILKGEIESNQPPSTAYLRAYWKYIYYERITEILHPAKGGSSKNVAVAIEQALLVYDDGNKYPISQAEKSANRQSAINLLKQ